MTAIIAVCCPDHINVECLGNAVPHLHWHLIPRYRTDPRWGAPVWTTTLQEFPDVRLPDAERVQLIGALRGRLG